MTHFTNTHTKLAQISDLSCSAVQWAFSSSISMQSGLHHVMRQLSQSSSKDNTHYPRLGHYALLKDWSKSEKMVTQETHDSQDTASNSTLQTSEPRTHKRWKQCAKWYAYFQTEQKV
ncbi:hypothetical protein M8J76_017337 [Diaphorina citri]|nr:hypothetical protein M8J76_017337 [Diaphorina citri]